MIDIKNPILFFDGYCNLCNRVVLFFIKKDHQKILRFASLQSNIGQLARKELKEKNGQIADSVVLYWQGRYYVESEAAIRAIILLGGVWKLAKIGFIFPAFIRDRIYRWIARNRHKWFGKKTECMVPTPELETRFIED